MTGPTDTALLDVAGVGKHYGGVRALADVSLRLRPGRVLALVGENGAGKSTLLGVISGLVRPDTGTVRFDGRAVRTGKAAAMLHSGIGTVHQELTVFPNLTVWENVFLGHETVGRGRGLARRELSERTAALLAGLGETIDPETLVGDLPLAGQQMVEIAKALSRKPRLLILDEATSALDAHQVEALFTRVGELTADGVGVIFVSHRMPEIFELCDEAVVLKDGSQVAAFEDLSGIDEHRLVEVMVGRTLDAIFPERGGTHDAEPLLSVTGLAGGAARDVSLTVRPGEIVGLGGLQGHGQQDVLRLLFGALRRTSGTVTVGGDQILARRPREAMAAGIAYLPPDRKTEGLALPHSVEANLTLPLLDGAGLAGRLGILRQGRERRLIASLRGRLQIRQHTWRQPVQSLSGGNQQKVALGKWLDFDYRVLLLDEPTRGVDVGTKREIYRLLRELADQGKAVLIASTETMELLGLCDRIYALYEGVVERELSGDSLTETALTQATLGISAASGKGPS
jgi:ABC-type sugar transport system ATPase subunit